MIGLFPTTSIYHGCGRRMSNFLCSSGTSGRGVECVGHGREGRWGRQVGDKTKRSGRWSRRVGGLRTGVILLRFRKGVVFAMLRL